MPGTVVALSYCAPAWMLRARQILCCGSPSPASRNGPVSGPIRLFAGPRLARQVDTVQDIAQRNVNRVRAPAILDLRNI